MHQVLWPATAAHEFSKRRTRPDPRPEPIKMPTHLFSRYRPGFAGCACAIFGMATLTCFAADPAGDVVLFNGRVFTAEPEHPYADSVVIRGDRIVAVGSLSGVETAVRA